MHTSWHRAPATMLILVTGLLIFALAACEDLDEEPRGGQRTVADSPTATPTPGATKTEEPAKTETCGHDDKNDRGGSSVNGEAKVQLDDEILRQAEQEGTVSVIVTLDIPYSPEADLDSQEEVDEQRAAIAAAQDELVASLEGHEVTETTRYEQFPQIALTVDKAALLELSRSPLVEDIQGNVLDAPTS